MLAQHSHELLVLLALVCNSLHFEMKVRTIDAGLYDAKLSDVQLLLDVGRDFRSGRRGNASTGGDPSDFTAEPSDRYAGRKSCPHSEMQCASSITTKLIVCFRKSARNSCVVNRSGVIKMKSLFSVLICLEVFLALLCGERAVQLRSFQARVFQFIDLIFHQRDQRRYDHGRAGQMQCQVAGNRATFLLPSA